MAKRARRRVWCTLSVGSLQIVAHLRPRTAKERRDEQVGGFDSGKLALWVADDIAPDHAEATLLHEIAHAVFYALGLPVGDEDTEERVVNQMSALIYDVLKRNGMLAIPARPEAT